MRRELAVQDLALLEDVRVELNEGFCAWTGETRAGRHDAGRGERRHDASNAAELLKAAKKKW